MRFPEPTGNAARNAIPESDSPHLIYSLSGAPPESRQEIHERLWWRALVRAGRNAAARRPFVGENGAAPSPARP
jgi:hypothetical protein